MPSDFPYLGPSDLYGPCAPESVTDYGQGSQPYESRPPRFPSAEETERERDQLARFISRFELFRRTGETEAEAYERHKSRMDGTAMDRAAARYGKEVA